jgi:polysaccharide pyruvyl transferase WcaK-like protein
MKADKKTHMARHMHLAGYFDFNFGDDMMMKLVVNSLPDVTFAVADTVETPILSQPNVVQKSREDCAQLPKLIVTGSGFMINNQQALKAELLAFLRGRCPGDYCLGCNMEPLDTPLKRFLIRKKLNRFKLITCRDQVSYRWLCEKTRRPAIYYAPDILFSIPEQWLPAVNSPEKLGISLMHRAGDSADCAYYRIMAEAADKWICETGKGVILMAFDTGKENDLFACNAVRALMQHPNKAEIVSHRDCTEIPAAFAQCEKIIAVRLHGIVLALRMGIPLYPLIFREKARNLLNDIAYPFPVSTLARIDKASLQAFLEKPQMAYSLNQDIYEAAKEHAQLLAQALTATGL